MRQVQGLLRHRFGGVPLGKPCNIPSRVALLLRLDFPRGVSRCRLPAPRSNDLGSFLGEYWRGEISTRVTDSPNIKFSSYALTTSMVDFPPGLRGGVTSLTVQTWPETSQPSDHQPNPGLGLDRAFQRTRRANELHVESASEGDRLLVASRARGVRCKGTRHPPCRLPMHRWSHSRCCCSRTRMNGTRLPGYRPGKGAPVLGLQ